MQCCFACYLLDSIIPRHSSCRPIAAGWLADKRAYRWFSETRAAWLIRAIVSWDVFRLVSGKPSLASDVETGLRGRQEIM